ncbi:hypothetical protein BVY01_00825, partial [bacterium I07]
DPSKEYHTYALEWREGELNWYIDGKIVRTYKGKTPQGPMFVMLSLYEGCGWTGKVDATMKYPRSFEVDYIRVYARDRSSSAGHAHSITVRESDFPAVTSMPGH